MAALCVMGLGVGCVTPCGPSDVQFILDRLEVGGASAEHVIASTIEERCPAVPLAVRDQALAWAAAMDGGVAAEAELGAQRWSVHCPVNGAPFRAAIGPDWDAHMAGVWSACGAETLAPWRDPLGFASAGGPESAVVASLLYREFSAGGALDEARQLVEAIAYTSTGAEAAHWGRYAGRVRSGGLLVAPSAAELRGGVCQPLLSLTREGVSVEGSENRGPSDGAWARGLVEDLEWIYREANVLCTFVPGNGVLVAVAPDVDVAAMDAVFTSLAAVGETDVSILVAKDGGPAGTLSAATEFTRVGAIRLTLPATRRGGAFVDVHPVGFDVGFGGHRYLPLVGCPDNGTVTVCPAADGNWDWLRLDEALPDGTVDVAAHRAVRADAWVAMVDRLIAAGRLAPLMSWRAFGDRAKPTPLTLEKRLPTVTMEGKRLWAEVAGPGDAVRMVDGIVEAVAGCLDPASGRPVDVAVESGPEAPLITVIPSVPGDRAYAGCVWDALSSVRSATPMQFTARFQAGPLR